MKDFIKRLTSRKFLLTVAACLTFYANKQYTELAATVLTYLFAEGSADAVRSYANSKYVAPVQKQADIVKQLSQDDEVVDRSNIVPGGYEPVRSEV